MNEAMVAMSSAFLDSPRTVSAGPSSMVAAAATVPGVPTRMAVMLPPYTAPQYMPSRAENASTVGMLNVSGMIRATPMAAVSPGNAPKIIPSPVPTVHASNAAGARAC